MTRRLLISSLLFGAVLCSSQQDKTPDAGVQTITIRMLNGKTGKPVAGDLSNVWLGDQKHDKILKTDANGEIRVPVGEVQPRMFWFLPNYYSDCRYKKDTPSGMNVDYSLDKIISEGIVAENFCGKQHTQPVPGVFVIYVRNRTFWEGMRG